MAWLRTQSHLYDELGKDCVNCLSKRHGSYIIAGSCLPAQRRVARNEVGIVVCRLHEMSD